MEGEAGPGLPAASWGRFRGRLLLGEEEEEEEAREEEAERAQLRFEVEFRFLCGVDSLDRSGEDGPTYFLFIFFCLWEDGAAQF